MFLFKPTLSVVQYGSLTTRQHRDWKKMWNLSILFFQILDLSSDFPVFCQTDIFLTNGCLRNIRVSKKI